MVSAPVPSSAIAPHADPKLETPLVFNTMRNHEGISLGGRLSLPSPNALRMEWMLFPQVLEGCPERIKWAYNQNPEADYHARLGDFEIALTAKPLGGKLMHQPTGVELAFN